MQNVLAALQQFNFSTALVELYGLGLRHSSDGVPAFSRWQTAPRDELAKKRIQKKFASDEGIKQIALPDAEAAPLVLLSCIEEQIISARHHVIASDSAMRFADSLGAARWLLRRRNPQWAHYPARQSPNPRHFLKHHTCIPVVIDVADTHIYVDFALYYLGFHCRRSRAPECA